MRNDCHTITHTIGWLEEFSQHMLSYGAAVDTIHHVAKEIKKFNRELDNVDQH